ncbi:DgyrCDS7123 [Dimorphilus gyrociliatus]|uniref:DgyrCDS7123 n=1 Tax=Dimorphilus gyrociliatus TaxID=2664684 RepID=A0A7I8VQ48_9ANNE|nr:DgyrCDS7123 [Dimorphilus gyrociliatus]
MVVVLLAVILPILFRFIIPRVIPPHLGIYARPGGILYYLKFVLFLLIVKLRRFRSSRLSNVQGVSAGYGQRSKFTIEEMDRAQILPNDEPKAVDAVYFTGANEKGEYIVAATARRQRNLNQAFLFIRLPHIGLLQMPHQPDTHCKADDENKFWSNGLRIDSIEAMKKWKISYEGNMKLSSGKEVFVRLAAGWEAIMPYFDFDTDIPASAVSRAIAQEKWTKDRFERLRKAHQTHHEQFGKWTVSLEIDGEKRDTILYGVRDHSYGNVRDWRDIHRYALQYCYLEDGTCIGLLCICMPKTMSRLIAGYVSKDNKIDSITDSSLQLWSMGENGKPPNDYGFEIFTESGKQYTLFCKVIESPTVYIDGENDIRHGRIHERMATYNLDSLKGWGISEWAYGLEEDIRLKTDFIS